MLERLSWALFIRVSLNQTQSYFITMASHKKSKQRNNLKLLRTSALRRNKTWALSTKPIIQVKFPVTDSRQYFLVDFTKIGNFYLKNCFALQNFRTFLCDILRIRRAICFSFVPVLKALYKVLKILVKHFSNIYVTRE